MLRLGSVLTNHAFQQCLLFLEFGHCPLPHILHTQPTQKCAPLPSKSPFCRCRTRRLTSPWLFLNFSPLPNAQGIWARVPTVCFMLAHFLFFFVPDFPIHVVLACSPYPCISHIQAILAPSCLSIPTSEILPFSNLFSFHSGPPSPACRGSQRIPSSNHSSISQSGLPT